MIGWPCQTLLTVEREGWCAMDVIVERCAGSGCRQGRGRRLCANTAPSGRGRPAELRTFPTFTSGLEELADWLTANGVIEVVMEATGPYWKPIWYVLEDRGVRPASWSTPST